MEKMKVDLRDFFEFNPFAEKLNIGHAIGEIGEGKKIVLVFDLNGKFMISSGKDNYFPADQGELKKWDFQTSFVVPKNSSGDWPKYAAEKMIESIVEQMEHYALQKQ